MPEDGEGAGKDDLRPRWLDRIPAEQAFQLRKTYDRVRVALNAGHDAVGAQEKTLGKVVKLRDLFRRRFALRSGKTSLGRTIREKALRDLFRADPEPCRRSAQHLLARDGRVRRELENDATDFARRSSRADVGAPELPEDVAHRECRRERSAVGSGQFGERFGQDAVGVTHLAADQGVERVD